ncbi:hypothetical protein PCANC_13437 [Puccinia coronata f. sp. avenae]|uniref:Retrotransposon gag domain-containing protein n=1 Tax=Puccinia coronata f. sp. avenae TaxID=200324 RepID=A0A2N5V2F5_9BASI|nr:hypothetical protein PCANC_13437 [Puccinia coronata f. sp. avenae]
MSYGINNTDISTADETGTPQGPQPAQNPPPPADRTEMDAMRNNINRMQRSFDRLIDMMTAQAHFDNSPPSPRPPPQPPHQSGYQQHSSGYQQFPHHHNNQHPPPPPDPSFHHTFQSNLNLHPSMQLTEPLKLKDVWFAGDSANLLLFLRVIRDFLLLNQNFQSETRRVVWISRHFGYHPLEHRRTPLPVKNWYKSLVIDNARQQGVMDMYADLDGQEFVLPALCSVAAFLDGLITVFDNKFMRENAKRALVACKQKNMTIGEYNSKFKSLVYLVEDVEETRIEKYVLGLNPRIVWKAMSLPEKLARMVASEFISDATIRFKLGRRATE